MTFALYTITISPHQIPLAEELVKRLGPDKYRYIYIRDMSEGRKRLGWLVQRPSWMIPIGSEEAQRWLLEADVVMAGERDLKLFEERSRRGLKTIYCAERWFKPLKWGLPGRLRMLSPSYRSRARAMMDLVKRDPNFMLYPIGIHAARDFAWLLEGKIADFERKPGGRVSGRGQYLDKMRLWGYFVAPSSPPPPVISTSEHPLRVLWVGRMLYLKRVDTLICAVALAHKNGFPTRLTLVGDGPEKSRLQSLAKKLSSPVEFCEPVPIDRVRGLMRQHDVYVLTSNAYEGWGAVVSEALEEGMSVLGTREAGSTATILPDECLFAAGEAKRLARLLTQRKIGRRCGDWSVGAAAEVLVKEASLR